MSFVEEATCVVYKSNNIHIVFSTCSQADHTAVSQPGARGGVRCAIFPVHILLPYATFRFKVNALYMQGFFNTHAGNKTHLRNRSPEFDSFPLLHESTTKSSASTICLLGISFPLMAMHVLRVCFWHFVIKFGLAWLHLVPLQCICMICVFESVAISRERENVIFL